MKSYYLLIVVLLVTSCASDQPVCPNHEEDASEFTILENAEKGILKSLNENKSNRQALIQAIRAIPEVATLKEVQQNIDGNTFDKLELTLTDGILYTVNLTATESEETMSANERERFNSMVDSLQNNISSKIPKINSGADNVSFAESESSSLSGLTRVTMNNKRVLRKKKAVLISVDTNLRNEDIHYINLIKDKAGNATKIDWEIRPISDYTPEYFNNLHNFDIIVWGSHGDVNGQVFFPSDCMSASQKLKYQKLVKSDKSGNITSYQENGVHPGTMTYRYKIGNKIIDKPRSGFYLSAKFWEKHLPAKNLFSNSILWSIHCFSSFMNGISIDGLDYVCNVRDIAEFFGSTTKCSGKDVYPIFLQWYTYLINGISSDIAWKNARPQCTSFTKKLGERRYFSCSSLSKAKYLKPEATGVKSTHTRSSDKAAPILVGARFRYNGNSNGKPEYTGNGGIILKEVASGVITTVPITQDMICAQHPVEISDGFVLNEIDVRIDGLKPETDYIYATYIDSDGEKVISDESFSFCTEKSDKPVYYISNEEEFKRIMTEPREGMAFLTKDITITSINNFLDLYNNLNGQGHKLTFNFPNADYYNYDGASVCICGSVGSKRFQWTNVVFSSNKQYFGETDYDILINNTQLINCNFDAIRLSTKYGEYGEITNCTLTNSSITIFKDAIMRDSKFIYKYPMFSPLQLVSNNGLVERCVFETYLYDYNYGHSRGLFYNSDTGIIRDCHLTSKHFIPFAWTNKGTISKCSVTCQPTEQTWFSPAIYDNSGIVEDFVSDIPYSYSSYGQGGPVCWKNTGKLVRCINRTDIRRTFPWGYNWLNFGYSYENLIYCSVAICENNEGQVIDCENYGHLSADPGLHHREGNYHFFGEEGETYVYIMISGVKNTSESAKVTGYVNHGTYGKKPLCPDCGRPYSCCSFQCSDVINSKFKDYYFNRNIGLE